jgi:hypothetical protein
MTLCPLTTKADIEGPLFAAVHGPEPAYRHPWGKPVNWRKFDQVWGLAHWDQQP